MIAETQRGGAVRYDQPRTIRESLADGCDPVAGSRIIAARIRRAQRASRRAA